MALTMLPAAIAFVEPDTQPWLTLPRSGPVFTLAFHPDGTTLTTAGLSDDSGEFWNHTQWHLPSGVRTAHRTYSADGDHDAILSSRGPLVTVGDTVRLWDAAEDPTVLLHSQPDHCAPNVHWADSPVTSVSISADGRSVVTGNERGLLLWPVATGGEPITVACGAGVIESVAVSSDGTKVAAGVDDGTVRLWDVATGTATTLAGPASHVSDLMFNSNGAVLAASIDGMARIWQVTGGVPLPLTTGGDVVWLALTPDGETVATYDWDGILRLWDVTTGRRTAILRHRAGHLNAAAFSPDGSTLATVGESGVQLWNVPELVAAQS
ncbi:MAG: WD40 repeat domain-containing protein [Pseudonocardiaceae bacterium]